MWYALYCRGRNEETVLASCKRNINQQILKDAFLFTCERMRRYEGAWHLETVKLFPDYVFLESEDGEALSGELEQYRLFVQVMEEKSDSMLLSVQKSEEQFLSELCGGGHHLAMSKGVIRGGIPFITQGPLRGKEQMISRIDRHKRLAVLRSPALLQGLGMKAGLEITDKMKK